MVGYLFMTVVNIHLYGKESELLIDMITEFFKIYPSDKNKIKPGLILAVDNNNPEYYVLADNNNTCIVGVVDNIESLSDSVAVKLCGCVKVKINTCDYSKPIIGGYVIFLPSKENQPGYGTFVYTLIPNISSNILGKVIKVIDNETVEIIVTSR